MAITVLHFMWLYLLVSLGHDELLNFRNEEEEDDDDDEDDDEVDEENDEDVGLEYLQKPVDELEVYASHVIAVLLVSVQHHCYWGRGDVRPSCYCC